MSYAQLILEEASGTADVDVAPLTYFTRTINGLNVKRRPVGPRKALSAPGRSFVVPAWVPDDTNKFAWEYNPGAGPGENLFFFGYFQFFPQSKGSRAGATDPQCGFFDLWDQYGEGWKGPGWNLDLVAGTIRPRSYNFATDTYTYGTAMPHALGTPIWLGIGKTYNSGSNTYSLQFVYRYPGDADWTIVDNGVFVNIPAVALGSGGHRPYMMAIFNSAGGTWQAWMGRMACLGVGTISSFADITWAATGSGITEQDSQHDWYCNAAGAGTGEGDSAANAMSHARLLTETNSQPPAVVIPRNYPWVQTGTTTPLALNNDVEWLDSLRELGLITHVGDKLYIDTGSGSSVMRLTASVGSFIGMDGVQILPWNQAYMNFDGSALATSWTHESGNVYSIPYTVSAVGAPPSGILGTLFENGAWTRYYPLVSNGAALIASLQDDEAGVTCSGWDGSKMYVRVADGSNPNTNGRTYEYGTGFGVHVGAPNTYIHHFTCHKGSRVRNDFTGVGTGGTDATNGYGCYVDYRGYMAVDHFNVSRYAKHCSGMASPMDWSFSRIALTNFVSSQVCPSSYSHFGDGTNQVVYYPDDQGIFYLDKPSNTNPDTEILFRNGVATETTGVVGSTVGQSSSTVDRSGLLMHNNAGSANWFIKRLHFVNYQTSYALENNRISPWPISATPDCYFGVNSRWEIYAGGAITVGSADDLEYPREGLGAPRGSSPNRTRSLITTGNTDGLHNRGRFG